MIIQIGEMALEAEIQPTRGTFSKIILGEMEISETGDLILEVRPIHEGWQNVELAKIELVKK